jgi:hypothetical protein
MGLGIINRKPTKINGTHTHVPLILLSYVGGQWIPYVGPKLRRVKRNGDWIGYYRYMHKVSGDRHLRQYDKHVAFCGGSDEEAF